MNVVGLLANNCPLFEKKIRLYTDHQIGPIGIRPGIKDIFYSRRRKQGSGEIMCVANFNTDLFCEIVTAGDVYFLAQVLFVRGCSDRRRAIELVKISCE